MTPESSVESPTLEVERLLEAARRPVQPPPPLITAVQSPAIDTLIEAVFRRDSEYRRYGDPVQGWKGPRDFILLTLDRLPTPDDIFTRLRLGGQIVIVDTSRQALAAAGGQYLQRGYSLETAPRRIPRKWLGFDFSWLRKSSCYMVIRKTNLVLPRDYSDRFTYNVHLSQLGKPAQWVIQKEVPSEERVMARLKHRFPDAADDLIAKRAQKFTRKIFPLFLTREAALLDILQRDLPVAYRNRVPRVLHREKDERGYVQKIWMTWLRLGSQPLSQGEFARQAADLLDAVHESVGIMHLDLRLDNVVISDEGVCFVDFGSAVRMGENLAGNPLLSTLFEELMRTSQIQRMLEKMTLSGHVTSKMIQQAYGRVDKQVDLFYLALQMSTPHANPDLADLIMYDPKSVEAGLLQDLCERILRPRDPRNPEFRSAHDIFVGVCQVQDQLRKIREEA